jgi:hypothetical protein
MGDSTLVDPLGRVLVMRDRTWLGHIAKTHPELADYRTLAENAVQSPDEIRMSRSDPDCRIYFGPGPRSTVRMMVVGDVVRGVVKTAHLCSRISGGQREWSK